MTINTSEITDGPSKWNLILALFEPDQQTSIMFTTTGSKSPTNCVVNSAARLDENGEEWILECEVPFSENWHFRAIYSTRTRKGMITQTWQPEKHETWGDLKKFVLDNPERLLHSLYFNQEA